MKHAMFIIPALCFAFILPDVIPTTASAAEITELVSNCEDCHGKAGVSTDHDIPTIGGLSAQYIMDSFAAYKDKSRPCEEEKYLTGPHKGEKSDMCKVTEKLSAGDSKQLADHFAARPFVRASQPFDAALAKKGEGLHALQCNKCHENAGSSADDDAGILAGQWMLYMQEQFDVYASGKRVMPEKMKPKMEKLSRDDIKALIHYYGSFQGSAGK
jgi:sulfide dehydrogenase cytochrome subunit